jgi:hypothetical protein
VDVRHDREFFGRGEELFQLVRNIALGKHTLITGAKGVGKSRLMEEGMAVLRGEVRHLDLSLRLAGRMRGGLGHRPGRGEFRTLFVRRSTPLGECLKEMAAVLHAARCLRLPTTAILPQDWESLKKEFTRLGSVGSQEAVIESFRRSSPPWIVFIDTLDRITTAHQQFLEDLLGCAVVGAAAARLNTAAHFRKIWSSFSRVELDPLDDATATLLVRHCLEVSAIRVLDPELYVREILKSANGNPFSIKNLIWLGSRERHVTTEEVRKVRRLEEGDLFNMGPIYILMASILTLFRIFSFGTDNKEFYIYFSALGFIVYLVFRVFRTFFLFKPQRVNT